MRLCDSLRHRFNYVSVWFNIEMQRHNRQTARRTERIGEQRGEGEIERTT